MIRHLLIASAATLALTAPVAAERGGSKGQGSGQAAHANHGGDKPAKAEHRGGGDRQQARVERRGGADRQQARVERRANREVRFAQTERGNRGRNEVRIERRNDNVERRANRIDRVERRADRQVQRIERRAERAQLRANDVVRVRDVRENRRFAVRGDDRRFDRDDQWVANFARGVGGCPPGLSNKNPLCMPPGQYKKTLGTTLPTALRASYVPDFLRNTYRDDDDYYYRWNDGLVYRVDRDSNLINSLIPLFGGGLMLGQQFPSMYSNYYVPTSYQPFYQDSFDDYYRYNNGYVYEIDRDSGLIEDIIPLYDNGYGIGQMLPASYSYYNLPYQYRDTYRDDDDYFYRYAPGAIYQVDRDTQLISAIASLLTGGTNFGIGQQLPLGYDMYNVPYAYRDQYYDTADNWYRYNNGYIYQVDPTTRLITAVIDAIV